jgi:Tol biopolymer transport system component
MLINTHFSIAPDGQRVAFEANDAKGASHVWIAPLDRRSPPQQLTSSIAYAPEFEPEGRLYFLVRDGNDLLLYRLDSNETEPRKIGSGPLPDFHGLAPQVVGFLGLSPQADWRISGLSP